jgi:hypothetical protein
VSVCAPSATPVSTGCAAGSVCTATTASRSRCVSNPAVAACPSAYTSVHPVGSAVIDTRACAGSCTCGSLTATCVNATWTFYGGNGSCAGPGTPLVMDGQCDAQGAAGGMTYDSYRYSADPQASCGTPASTPTATGAATLSDPGTLCCAP